MITGYGVSESVRQLYALWGRDMAGQRAVIQVPGPHSYPLHSDPSVFLYIFRIPLLDCCSWADDRIPSKVRVSPSVRAWA